MATERGFTFHSAVSATAVGSVFNTRGLAAVLVQVSGTFVATVTFQGTVDGNNWVALLAENLTDSAAATTATAAGLYLVPVVGVQSLRCNMAWTSGTSVTVKGNGTSIPAPVIV